MSIKHNLNQVRELIARTEKDSHREPNSVLLVAVTKKQSVEVINEAYHLGINQFAENYLQEAQKKMVRLKELPLTWHFIGPIQSNKAKAIATHFTWVHSINRPEIALSLNKYRAGFEQPLQVCVQVNLIEEKSKSGIPKEQTQQLVLLLSQLPNLELRGLMTIPPPNLNEIESYDLFNQLRQLKDNLNEQLYLTMDTLSMGMSDDLVPAIKAGATLIRIGRALFGERN